MIKVVQINKSVTQREKVQPLQETPLQLLPPDGTHISYRRYKLYGYDISPLHTVHIESSFYLTVVGKRKERKRTGGRAEREKRTKKKQTKKNKL